MVNRVTFNRGFDTTVRRIQDVSSQYQKALDIASSGKRVQGPSDDPGAYRRIESGRSLLQQFDDYRKGIGNAVQEMQTADGVLQTVYDRLSRARELAVQGASDTWQASDRASMAQEVHAVWDDVLLASNSVFNNRYIFAGMTYTTAAYSATGVYQGDANQRTYIAGLNYTLPVSMTGDEVFGTAAGGVDVFNVLTTLETAMNANSTTGIQATLDDLDSALAQIAQARTTYGVRAAQAEETQRLYTEQATNVTGRVSQEGDADAAASFTDVARLSTAFQATLQVSASASKLSLLDYI